MELNTQAIEEFLTEEELKEVKDYFTVNESGIRKELAEIDQHIALRPLAVIFKEPNEELHRNYPTMSFSEEVKEDGSTGVYAELIK